MAPEIRKITAVIPGYTKTPVAGTATFPEDIELWDGEVQPNTEAQQQMAGEQNDMATDMEANAVYVEGLAQSTEESSAEAQTAALQAESSANYQGVWKAQSIYPSGFTGYAVGMSAKYNGAFYRCDVANSDEIFDPSKWSINVALSLVGNITNNITDLNFSSAKALQSSFVGEFRYECDTDNSYVNQLGILRHNTFYSETGVISGSLFNLNDAGQSWTNGELEDYVIKVTTGGVTEYRWIVGNTATSCSFSKPLVVSVDGTTTYEMNKPRFWKEGLSSEGSSTNNILHSEDISNVAYTQSGVTIGTPSLSPDGINNYQEIIEDSATNRHTNYQIELSTDPQSDFITVSRFVKRGVGSRDVTLYCSGTGFQGVDRFGKTFDLGNGTVKSGGTDTAGLGVYVGSRIKELFNGWFLISVSGSIKGTASTQVVNSLAISESSYINGSIGDNRLGDGISSIICGGVQTEELPFGTSLITTTTAPKLRGAEFANIAFEGNMLRWKDVSSITMEMSTLGEVYSGVNRLALTTGALGDGYIVVGSTGSIAYSTAATADTTNNIITPTEQNKITCVNDGAILSQYTNGVLESNLGINGIGSENNTGIYIGYQGNTGGSHLYGFIKYLKLNEKAFSATESASA